MKKACILLVSSFVSLFSVSAQTEFETILSQIHADSLKKTVEDLVAFDNRLCCATVGNNKKVAQYLIQRLQNYGVENAAIDSFFVSIGYHWLLNGGVNQYMYNVKGRLSGSVNPDSVVIIGAHLDAICYDSNYKIQSTTPGANDNATGIAVMIEVARIFHANNLTPIYSIDFMAFDAEEIGLFGSKYDANKRKTANEKVYVMLNNDMVGLQSEEEDEWKVVFHADADDVQNKAVSICSNYTLLHPYIPDNMDSSYRNSDSWAYRLMGFNTFYTHEYEDDPYYHSLSDKPQRMNYHYMTEIAKLHFSLLYDFAIESIIKNASLNESALTSTFTIYPNPTTGQLTVNKEQLTMENTEYSIYSIVGQLVMRGRFPSRDAACHVPTTINVESLAKGMYFLRIGDKVVGFVKE